MKTRVLIAVVLMVLAAAAPAFAQGNGNNGNGGNNGNSDSSRDDRSGGNGNGNGRGNGNGNGGIKEPRAGPPSSATEPAIVPEGELLPMVETGQAVSLVSLLPDIEARTGGQLIDAQLVRQEHTLLYAVKVLTPTGRVGVEYYDARSGRHIEVP